VKLKLDENLGRRGAELLRQAGHDAVTVTDQNLSGSADRRTNKNRSAALPAVTSTSCIRSGFAAL